MTRVASNCPQWILAGRATVSSSSRAEQIPSKSWLISTILPGTLNQENPNIMTLFALKEHNFKGQRWYNPDIPRLLSEQPLTLACTESGHLPFGPRRRYTIRYYQHTNIMLVLSTYLIPHLPL